MPSGKVDPKLARETLRLQESLERRMADRTLLASLAAHDFAGLPYKRFEEELAGYGIAVMRGWMYSGHVFTLAKSRGFSLHPTEWELEEFVRSSDARDELANMTVALALPRFREQALVGGGWRFEGGASLPTYFMGACLYVFPNEFRRYRVARLRWGRGHRVEATLLPPESVHVTDPAVLSTGTIRVLQDLGDLPDRTKAIIALTLDDYSQEEIAELLGTTVRAVEGVVYRWRTGQKEHSQRGVRDD